VDTTPRFLKSFSKLFPRVSHPRIFGSTRSFPTALPLINKPLIIRIKNRCSKGVISKDDDKWLVELKPTTIATRNIAI
jgi:hypothetical protein